jgi:hypothetical protein
MWLTSMSTSTVLYGHIKKPKQESCFLGQMKLQQHRKQELSCGQKNKLKQNSELAQMINYNLLWLLNRLWRRHHCLHRNHHRLLRLHRNHHYLLRLHLQLGQEPTLCPTLCSEIIYSDFDLSEILKLLGPKGKVKLAFLKIVYVSHGHIQGRLVPFSPWRVT